MAKCVFRLTFLQNTILILLLCKPAVRLHPPQVTGFMQDSSKEQTQSFHVAHSLCSKMYNSRNVFLELEREHSEI